MRKAAGYSPIILVVGLGIVAVMAFLLWSYRPTFDHSAGNPSQEHPGFPLPDLKGKMRSPADYRGKVVLVNFWATWCPPCRAEIPDFNDLYKQYHDRGFEILGVAIDEESEVKPFVAKYNINYPVLMGNEKISDDYQLKGIPTTLVLDRQGKLHKRVAGALSRDELEAIIKSLL